jgi:hypothetical protein
MRILLLVPTILVLGFNLLVLAWTQILFPTNAAWFLGIALNLYFLVRAMHSHFSSAKIALSLGFLLWATLAAFVPRNPSPDLADRLLIINMLISSALGIGTLTGHRITKLLYSIYFSCVLVAFVSGLLADETLNVSSALIPIAVATAFGLSIGLELHKYLRQIRHEEGFATYFTSIGRNTLEPFKALGWIEYFGIFVVAISLIRIASNIAPLEKLLGSLYRIFIEIYSNTIEIVPNIIFEEAFFLFGKSAPVWLTPTLVIVGVLIRAADLHSKRYGDAPLWTAILERIVNPSSHIQIGEGKKNAFSGKEIEAAISLLNFMIVASVLSYYDINPLRWFAPQGGVSIWSLLAVGVTAYCLGALAKMLHELPQKYDGRWVMGVIYILVFLRGLYYGPALVLIAPFVAWRILIVSICMIVLLAAFSTGIDLVRPEIELPMSEDTAE